MKILSPLVTFVLMSLYSAAGLFFLMIALNGFSERQATPVFIGYFAVAFICTIGSATLAWLLSTKWLAAKMGQWGAAIVAILLSTILGAAAIFILTAIITAIGANLR